jgi:hypothetical protein
MADIVAPVLPEHIKKPNEEEYKKKLEQVNGKIEKVQKEFVSSSDEIYKTREKRRVNMMMMMMMMMVGCCKRENQ